MLICIGILLFKIIIVMEKVIFKLLSELILLIKHLTKGHFEISDLQNLVGVSFCDVISGLTFLSSGLFISSAIPQMLEHDPPPDSRRIIRCNG